jgi:hypothetical protein
LLVQLLLSENRAKTKSRDPNKPRYAHTKKRLCAAEKQAYG